MEEKQECPSGACQELQDIWAEGKGCYDPASKYCKECGKDEPATKTICEQRTLEAKVKKVEAKAKKTVPRSSKVSTVGFGHVIGTQAAAIDSYLLTGMTKEEMVKQLNKDGKNFYSIEDSKLGSRIQTHFNHLKKLHGVTINKDAEKRYFVLQQKGE